MWLKLSEWLQKLRDHSLNEIHYHDLRNKQIFPCNHISLDIFNLRLKTRSNDHMYAERLPEIKLEGNDDQDGDNNVIIRSLPVMCIYDARKLRLPNMEPIKVEELMSILFDMLWSYGDLYLISLDTKGRYRPIDDKQMRVLRYTLIIRIENNRSWYDMIYN